MSLFGPNGELNGLGGSYSGPEQGDLGGRGSYGDSLLTRLSTGLPGPQALQSQAASNQQTGSYGNGGGPFNYGKAPSGPPAGYATQQNVLPPQQQTPYGLPQMMGSAALYAPPPNQPTGFQPTTSGAYASPDSNQQQKPNVPTTNKTNRYVWLAVLVVLLIGSVVLVVFLLSRGNRKKAAAGLRKKVRFPDDEEEANEERPSRSRAPRGDGLGRGPASGDAQFDRPVRRPTPAELHYARMGRDTHRDSVVRATSGRSDRLRPEPGYEGDYPESDWNRPSGGPRPIEQPDGSLKLPPNADIPLPSDGPGGDGMGGNSGVGVGPNEPMPAPTGGSSSMPSPIEQDMTLPIGSGQPTPVADAFSTPIGN